MSSIQHDMAEFEKQLESGAVQRAYRALYSYLMGLRAHFKNAHPHYVVTGLYPGYLDMTYFALIPPSLKSRDLKIAIVFNYHAFRFEAWLSATNRKVQKEYWELLKDNEWPGYRVVAPAPGVDSILECDLAEDFNLDEPEALTAQIDKAATAFIDDIERFLRDA
jgi:hypothetical protein